MGRLVAAVIALAGCGRLGFDPTADAGGGDATDAAGPFTPAAGMLDPSFAVGGLNVTGGANEKVRPFDVHARTGGGYLAFGTHELGGAATFMIEAYRADGMADTAFGTNSVLQLGPTGNDFGYTAVHYGSRFVMLGDGADGTATLDDITAAIVDETGARDMTFGTIGFGRYDVQGANRADTADAVVIDGTDLVVCGTTGYDQGDSHLALLRIDAAGTLVSTWGLNGTITDDLVAAVQNECAGAVRTATQMIAVGRTGQRGFVAAYSLADGTRDLLWGTNGFVTVGQPFAELYAAALVGGDVIAVGESAGRGVVTRLDAATGAPRTGFGTNGVATLAGTSVLFAVAEQPDGKLIVVGEANNAGLVARIDGTTGALDPTFSLGGRFTLDSTSGALELFGLLIEPSGAIVAVGTVGTGTPLYSLILRLR